MTDYSGLPHHMREGMRRYIEHGIPGGSFLNAVVSNDLMGALKRADEVNAAALPAYGRFLYNHAPCGCWGSKEAVASWVDQGGLAGMNSEATQ